VLIPLAASIFPAGVYNRCAFLLLDFDLPAAGHNRICTARRHPLAGLLTGGLIGIMQDALTHQPIGLYGISKTVVGFRRVFAWLKLDVENAAPAS